ncbi:MAG: LCP family protein, partial [Chloroflexota bacterium]|nr:LCP family protein [Chloroflexota bacterium]
MNELFSIGGAELVMRSAENLLGTPIDFYLTIDFEGFRRIIDALGGVEIDVKYDINDYRFPNADDTGFDPFIIKQGVHHMNGDTLLCYVRTRFDDPRGDFGRIDRQQQALVALKSQLLTFQSLVRIPLLLNELHGTVDTNFPLHPQRVAALARLGLAIPRERVYS